MIPLPHEHKFISVWHRVVALLAVVIIALTGFEALVYVNNLYQPVLYIQLSGFIYLIFIFWTMFIFDLHFKQFFSGPGNVWQVLKTRFHYMGKWEHFRHFQNYLVLPGIIYWGSIVIIGINFGHYKLQQFIVSASVLSLIGVFALLKEIFRVKQTPINNNHFLILGYIKLYAAWLIYSAALGIVWFYCFPPHVFYLVIYLTTFMLLYQACFQFAALRFRNVLAIFIISLAVAIGSYFVYQYWNVNYFSAGLFLAAIYNLLWSSMFHIIRKSLTKETLLEQLAIFALIVIMVFGLTNFNARILRCG